MLRQAVEVVLETYDVAPVDAACDECGEDGRIRRAD